ncbi:exodeoxyribonuclease V subunit alpha [Rosenbergiella collisarenosi]|uniref:exodeoxyribonuclease V subunit alpha n=1 Tax=Rosenbergiella collisarenosi TaxID=1544695 RepID=UPI001BDA4F9F|nr:exodeoxyribonuclease V subunit alpha [Rosenbergiella collisarenosi]MBT0722724.1 exodeoxyribonuclease V subunit alpha [Rosenbergiella collisarenosi]
MNPLDKVMSYAHTAQLFRPVDLQFARLVCGGERADYFLAAACVSASAGEGHVCIDLASLTPAGLWAGSQRVAAEGLWQLCEAPMEAEVWQRQLEHWPALSSPTHRGPLCLVDHQLYLQRAWQYEQQVAAFFNAFPEQQVDDEAQARLILDRLFGEASHNDQKVAAAVALTARHAIISGGPGTGKTTTVAKLLAAMIQLSPNKLRIQMAAPTGKAAARLTESLGKALLGLEVDDAVRQRFPREATTLHRLLGAQATTRQLRYHAQNPLHLDVLIVDEASMVDLTMMANLIAALPASARVIFLGDRDQLASVEAGAVLGDICRSAEYGYSRARAAQLTRLTGCVIAGNDLSDAPRLRESICLLTHSYRFDGDSGIGQLAKAVNQGDSRQAQALLAGEHRDIHWRTLADEGDWQTLLTEICQGYQPFLAAIASGSSPHKVVSDFGHYQVLCALREGAFGVKGLNQSIETALRQRGLLPPLPPTQQAYVGRPIMITRNDSSLGLFNGDIGITLLDDEQQLKVYFQLPSGELRAVQPSRLPEHETAWVMTVHKSQGSEFTHTALVLPRQFSPVLSRELIYTAITRAKSQLTLYGEASMISRAIANQTSRRSGLTAALR